jgi:hypothetical protein
MICGGCSVGIVRLQTKATVLFFFESSSEEKISLQWQQNQVEHREQNLNNPTSDSELGWSGKSETT